MVQSRKTTISCNFAQIALGGISASGSYCGTDAKNYVVNWTSYDAYEPYIWLPYKKRLLESVSAHRPNSLAYYSILADNSSALSYAVSVGKSYYIAIHKADLLARLFIYPPDAHLPAYELERVDILHREEDEDALIHRFKQVDILRAVTAAHDDGLSITRRLHGGSVVIRFVHRAKEPTLLLLKDNSKDNSEELANIRKIYQTLGREIRTDIVVGQFYNIRQLPQECVDKARFYAELDEMDFYKSEIDKQWEQLSDARGAKCSPAQEHIANKLPMFIENERRKK
ncbi:hypothetical protein AGMMS49941_11000 [Deferribacterales bacterium]|nr:hypothetical protein AGMMS49941_11000 [Deferribacterales bacterium]